jgi:hypothetical protein
MSFRGVSIIFIVLFALSGADAADTAERLPMKVFDHMLFVDVKINGKGPYRMIFDTGAGVRMTISKELAGDLKLPIRTVRQRISGVGNTVLHFIDGTTVDRVQIGESIEHADVDVMVYDFTDVRDALGKPFDGVIGLGLLRDKTITIDTKAERLIVEEEPLDEPDFKRTFAFLWKSDVPVVQVWLGDRTVSAWLDTGCADAISIVPATARNLSFKYDWRDDGVSAGIGVPARSKINRLDGDLRLGPLVIREPIVTTSSCPLIGMRTIEQMRLTIDQRNQRVRFEPYDDKPIEMPSERITGVAFRRRDTGWIAHSMQHGSPAEKLDIQVDDAVSHINGQPVSEHDRETYRKLLDSEEVITMTVHRGEASWEVQVPVVVWVE